MRNYYLALISFLVLGSWSYNGQAQAAQEKLIVGVKDAPPFVIFEEDGTYSGISVWLWEKVASEQNIDYQYKPYDLDGLLKAVANNEVDLSINPLTVTAERLKQMDFTQPFYITSLAIAVNTDDSNALFAFVQNFFSWQFFSAVGLLVVVLAAIGIIAWLFERKANPDEFGGKGLQGLWQGLWWSAVTMTTVGYGDKSPRTAGGRIVALIWMFASIIIISGFTASIASALTVNELETNINGPEDLRRVKTLTVEASTGANYLNAMHIDYRTRDNLDNAIQSLVEGQAAAVVYDDALLQYTLKQASEIEDVAVLPARFFTQYYSFAFQKNHPLLEQINPILLEEIRSSDWNAQLGAYGLDQQ